VQIGASAAVSRIITVAEGIVDIPPYMRRIITAAVVVGIIIVDISRTYRQVNPWAAATTFAPQHIILGAFAGFQNGFPRRCGTGHRRNAEETDR
jgi:hypothetical protein